MAIEIERLKTLLKFFNEVPAEKVRMYHWTVGSKASCLTAGCLAGWAGTIPEFNKAGFTLKLVEGSLCPYHEPTGSFGYNAFSEFFGMTRSATFHLCAEACYPCKVVGKYDVIKRLQEYIEERKL